MIAEILSENKGGTKEDKAIGHYRKFFPDDYTTEQMDDVIIKLLRGWRSENGLALEKSA
jgi:hypothetical protein